MSPKSTIGENARAELELRRRALEAIIDYQGSHRFPNGEIDFDELHLIDRAAIIDAGVLIVILMNLSSGSSGEDWKLYELLLGYFHNHEFKARVNELICQLQPHVPRNASNEGLE